jgi:hypothetical protein
MTGASHITVISLLLLLLLLLIVVFMQGIYSYIPEISNI